MTNPQKFTNEQRDWICYMIGEWYLHWVTRMTQPGCPHKLGRATEDLKQLLFDRDGEADEQEPT